MLHEGQPELAVGSAGSNRIRSAILQTIINVVDRGRGAQEAVDAPRLHYENGVVEAEAGVNADALEEIERDGWQVVRWQEKNLYFGGVQAVARNPADGRAVGRRRPAPRRRRGRGRVGVRADRGGARSPACSSPGCGGESGDLMAIEVSGGKAPRRADSTS